MEQALFIDGYRLESVLFESPTTTVFVVRSQDDGELFILKRLSSSRADEEFSVLLTVLNLSPSEHHSQHHRRLALLAEYTHVSVPVAVLPHGLLMFNLGRSLQDLIRERGRLSLMEVMTITHDIAVALGHCHARRILHLDVKPGNVVIREADGSAFLIDFNLSREMRRAGVTGNVHAGGTTAYMSPEQTGRLHTELYAVSAASDLYSLGVSMFQMLTGALPFTTARFPTTSDMVYAHLAVEPPPLPDTFPVPIRDMVARLLTKDPANRYSSVRSLVNDLDELLLGRPPTRLDAKPRHVTLQPLRRLYGRQQAAAKIMELCTMKLGLEGATPPRLVLVAGESGSGKSVLVQHVASRLNRADCVFGAGKFQQFDRPPYGALADALSNALAGIADSPLYDLLGSAAMLRHAAVLRDVCPLLLTLSLKASGALAEPQILAAQTPAEEEQRFFAAFSAVFAAFARGQRRLILFLDDLQWADGGSLRAIQHFPSGTTLLGAYRDNEMDAASHPTRQMLSTLREGGWSVNVVTLPNLSATSVEEILYDMMGVSDVEAQLMRGSEKKVAATAAQEAAMSDEAYAEEMARRAQSRRRGGGGGDPSSLRKRSEMVSDPLPDSGGLRSAAMRDLADLILKRTQGNPFFTLQFINMLAENRLLYYSWGKDRWEWNLVKVKAATSSTKNVVAFLLEMMATELPPDTQRLVSALAVCGFRVPLSFKAALCERLDLCDDLDLAIGMEIVAVVDSCVVFLHDRLQEGAAGLTPKEDLPALQFIIGHELLRYLQLDVRNPRLNQKNLALSFAAVDQLLAAESHVLKDAYLTKLLANLAVQAGRSARRALAYGNAVAYLAAAARLETDPAVIWQIKLEQGQASVLALECEKGYELFEECLKTATEAKQRKLALFALVTLDNSQQCYVAAIERGAVLCEMLGLERLNTTVTLAELSDFVEEFILRPVRDSESATVTGLFAVFVEAEPDSDAELLDLTLSSLIPSSFLSGNILLHTLLGAHVVAEAIKRRTFTRATSAGISVFAFSSSFTLDMKRKCYELGFHVAEPLFLRRSVDAFQFDGVHFVHLGLIAHWSPGVMDGMALFDRAFEISFRVGDFAWSAYSRTFSMWYGMQMGWSPAVLVKMYEERVPFVENLGMSDMFLPMRAVWLAARLLLRGKHEPEGTDLADIEMDMTPGRPGFTRCGVFVYLALAYHLVGRSTDALRLVGKVREDPAILPQSSGMSPHYEFSWIESSIIANSMVGELNVQPDDERLVLLRGHLAKLEEWASIASYYWAAKRDYVAALLRSLDPNAPFTEVLGMFEVAHSSAQATNMRQVDVLAARCAASYVGVKQPAFGVTMGAFLELELDISSSWGATKLAKILTANPVLSERRASLYAQTSGSGSYSHPESVSTSTAVEIMDAEGMARAAQILSQDLNSEQSLRHFGEILAAQAGADMVLVATYENSQFELAMRQAASVSGPEGQMLSFDRERIKEREAPLGLFHQLAEDRKRDWICVRDVRQESRLMRLRDEYFKVATDVASAIVLPIRLAGALVGVVYLENRSLSGVFHEGMAKNLHYLVTQLGISLQNARLFETLEQQHRATLRFVPGSFLARLGATSTVELKRGDAARKELAVLFADVRGFTTISESMNADGVFAFLNLVLDVAIPCVSQYRGTVDKFLGDGYLCLFDRPEDALGAARLIHASLRALNKRNGPPEVRMGIGIHFGATMIGCLGVEERLDATVVGDTVNLSSRLESITKQLHVETLVSRTCLSDAEVEDSAALHRYLGEVNVAGKMMAVPVYELLEDPVRLHAEGEHERAYVVEGKLATRPQVCAALAAWKKSAIGEATKIMDDLIATNPKDETLAVLLKQMTVQRNLSFGKLQ